MNRITSPRRTDSDTVSAERPIFVAENSGRLAVAKNSVRYLTYITADSNKPDGGFIRCDADGQTPNGVLKENALFNVMDTAIFYLPQRTERRFWISVEQSRFTLVSRE